MRPINRDSPVPVLKTNHTHRPPKNRKKTGASALARKYVLKLFVAGATARSTQAVLRIQKLCDAERRETWRLEVIDIYQQPALARKHQIVATPTLIKELPRPMRRFIGNLLNTVGLFGDVAVNAKNSIAV